MWHFPSLNISFNMKQSFTLLSLSLKKARPALTLLLLAGCDEGFGVTGGTQARLGPDEIRGRLFDLAALGERSTALRLYTRCVAMLQEDLGVEPMAETQALYNTLRELR